MKQENKIALTNGIALFAMFFGAGNLVFPLMLGSHAGHHLIGVWLAFILAGVGLPFLGVFTITLFKGDYWKFFSPLSKPLAFLVITFLILIIGPLFATPRTETVTFGSMQNWMPGPLQHPAIFSALYFLIVFLITLKQSHLTEILGKILGPVKITVFVLLIISAIWTGQHAIATPLSAIDQISNALSSGYNTMDLLAAFFFGGVIYQAIISRCQKHGIDFKTHATAITLKSCLTGGILLTLVYTGFMISAWLHAQGLQNVPTASMVSAISFLIFGQAGEWFVGLCIALTCIATASALTEVSSHYFYRFIGRGKVPRFICLVTTLLIMYAMSLLGFNRIIALASPILNWLYPLLILFCVIRLLMNTLRRKSQRT
ncbi:MAG: branched-chain amino acid transport system II carrier protein [Gammaproteobacteria bacterium]|nr:branched-chain amino acid transport system II carrier protein [Gammaproteobacteria bacterium]